MPKARDQMVVDHPDGLHVCVHNRAADELESALLEVFAERVGFLGRGWQMFHARQPILDWPAADETPNVFVKRAEFLLDVEELLGIRDCSRYFQAITNDSRVGY